MNVLSLFDGMSGGQQALERAGVDVTRYYASEVDKYAIHITQKNYPKTIQLGSITTLKKKQLKKLNIDFVIGGSPCQGFSMSGLMRGMTTKQGVEITTLKQYKKLKKKGFTFDGQSYLFWEYIRVLRIVKPKYFLLENVKVQNKWKDIFDNAIGVKPILINSIVVSPQNRPRYYWTNLPNIKPIIPKGVSLQSILMDDGYTHDWRTTLFSLAHNKECRLNKPLSSITGYNEVSTDANCKVSPHNTGALLASYPQGVQKFGSRGFIYNYKEDKFRLFTPTECERLQTVRDGYTDGVSNTQRYKMLGNGFTIDVIAHLLKGMV